MFGNEIMHYFSCLSPRGKEILEQLSKPRFLRSLEIAPFSSVLRSSGEKLAIFELHKKRGSESCSNIPFPLISYLRLQFDLNLADKTCVLLLFF